MRFIFVVFLISIVQQFAYSLDYYQSNQNLNQFLNGFTSYNKNFQNSDALSNNKVNSISSRPTFTYVGCYNDRRDFRDIDGKDYSFITKFNKSMPTVELCVSLCAQEGYSVAGVQSL